MKLRFGTSRPRSIPTRRSASARIAGSADNPRASFSVTGSGVAAAAIQPYGITPLSFEATGDFANGSVALERLSASGAGGLQLAANGSIPLAGGGMSLTVTGSAPLALANRLVADRGGQFGGTASLDARVTGSLAEPRFAGTVSTSGSSYTDPSLNLRLVDITGSASLAGDRLVIDSLGASLTTGGTLAASGSIGLDAANNADIRLRLNSARYADGDLLVATLSGDLALTGSLVSNPLLSGDVLVEEANITVPETFGGAAALIEVEHVQPAPAVMATLARARINEGDRSGPTSDLQLDVRLNAPNQVFIRGRGLDAELGGSVRLTGAVSSIQPVGSFSLIRGRLSVLGQRLTFESGQATLAGDLDPFIDLVARTEGDGITVFVTVSGRASEPDIAFTSNPALPEDEVLSRLIFNRGIGELSPLQVARLAGAAAELAGGGGTSLTESLRSAAGLADLDIVTDESGNGSSFVKSTVVFDANGTRTETTEKLEGHNLHPSRHWTLGEAQGGTMSQPQFDAAVADLTAFLAYVADPTARTRVRLGVWVLLFLGVFTIFAWMLNREYWKGIH